MNEEDEVFTWFDVFVNKYMICKRGSQTKKDFFKKYFHIFEVQEEQKGRKMLELRQQNLVQVHLFEPRSDYPGLLNDTYKLLQLVSHDRENQHQMKRLHSMVNHGLTAEAVVNQRIRDRI